MKPELTYTKRGNRILIGKKPETMSRSVYGVHINYSDFRGQERARTGMDLRSYIRKDNRTGIERLYFGFDDPLYGWMSKGWGYLTSRVVEINPVGGLFARRPLLTEKGKKRLATLRKKYPQVAKKYQKEFGK
jgi:hypothetical protein